jgi:choline-sulfatase
MSDEHNPLFSEPYGNASVGTPNMQKLARRGVVYENAYCPSPLCMPSRSAFIAGKRVHQLQTYSNCNLLVDPSPFSFGAALAQQDVYTAYIGKTDVYAPGENLGFCEMIRPGNRKLPGDSHHRRNPVRIRDGSRARASGYGPKENAGSHDVHCVDDAMNWIRGPASIMKTPWILVVNVVAPHFPHFASPEFWDIYSGVDDSPSHGLECESAQHPYADAIRRHFETQYFTEEHVLGLRRGYFACITFVDDLLGRLMEALTDAGMDRTTNIAYTSDHGDMLGKFGMWWKCSLYEDAVRIPMIAAGPDFAVNRRVSTPVDLHDLQAALFAASGADQPTGYLGNPLQNISENDNNRIVFSEYHGHGAPGSSYMVRSRDWKYIQYTGASPQLFNLADDPDELTNLADVRKDVALELDNELRGICSPERENERAESFIELQLSAIEKSSNTKNASPSNADNC